MRALFTVIYSIPVLLLASAAQADLQANSTISGVTIYPDSARITRTATLSLPAGETKITLANLPLEIEANSLRVSGQSTGLVSLGSVQLTEQLSTEAIQARERTLKAEIQRWQEKRQEVVDAKTRAEQQLEFIRATALQTDDTEDAAKNRINNLPLTQWQQAWQTLEAATADAQTKVRAAAKTIQEFDQGLAQLQQQLEQIATGQTSTRTASLYVKAQQAGDLTLTLSYPIRNAHWLPVYEADLDTKTGQLQFKTQAAIQQSTGEDWTNVKVQLSTLRPQANAQLPVLNSWILSLNQPPPVEQDYAKETEANGAAAANDKMARLAMPAAPAPIAAMKAQMTEENTLLLAGTYNVEYQVPGTLTLNTGGETRRVTLENQQFAANIELNSAPRFDPRAILSTEIPYQGKAVLIPGSVALYRDGNFIGNSQVPEVKPGEQLKLAFGEDDQVKIVFQPAPEKTTQAGLLSSRKRLDYNYVVTVHNQHAEARTLKLYDTIPVANTSDITIALTGEAPNLKDIEDKQGLSAWSKNIPANGKAELHYGYSISYPQDQSLSGL